MACKCKICGINDVDQVGDVCELCAIAQDPYAARNPAPQVNVNNGAHSNGGYAPAKKGNSRKVLLTGGSSLANRDPYGNDMTESEPDAQTPVQVYSPGQAPQVASQTPVTPAATTAKTAGGPLTSGITKNISTDTEKKSFLEKWFRTLFTGIPFALDNDVTMFQVFPDFSGTALNSQGNACDQVIVYGKLNSGVVSENNDIEVYGRRDSHNNIIARTIKNKASGTTITPEKTIGQMGVWIITAIVVILLAVLASGLGVEGIIWAAVIVLCLTNLPATFKILGVVFGALFSLLKRLF